MSITSSTRLLFSGEKCFWNSNLSVEVLFLEHSPLQIIEVIVYSSKLNYEAPHVYVDGTVLLAQVSQKGNIGDKGSWATDKSKIQYLFDRVTVTTYSHGFEVDVLSGRTPLPVESLMVEKPLELVAFVSPFAHFRRHVIPAVDAPATEVIVPNVTSTTNGVGRVINSPPCSRVTLMSVSDENVAYGAPPRPLYDAGKGVSSPNLANPLGSPGNPRIVPRRRPSLTAPVNPNAQPVVAAPPKVPTLLLTTDIAADTSAGTAQSSPRSSPRSTHTGSPRQRAPGADADQVVAGGRRVVPMLRFLNNTLSTLGLFSTSPRHAPAQEQEQTPRTARSRCSSTDYDYSDDGGEVADGSASVCADTFKSASVPSTPPSTARSITARHSSVQLTAVAAAALSAEVSKPVKTHRFRQRRHANHGAASADGAPSESTKTAPVATIAGIAAANVAPAVLPCPSTNAAAQSGAQSPHTKPLGVRYALDSLRLPHWSGAVAGGGSTSKISPSVSTAAMDQQDLDSCPP